MWNKCNFENIFVDSFNVTYTSGFGLNVGFQCNLYLVNANTYAKLNIYVNIYFNYFSNALRLQVCTESI